MRQSCWTEAFRAGSFFSRTLISTVRFARMGLQNQLDLLWTSSWLHHNATKHSRLGLTLRAMESSSCILFSFAAVYYWRQCFWSALLVYGLRQVNNSPVRNAIPPDVHASNLSPPLKSYPVCHPLTCLPTESPPPCTPLSFSPAERLGLYGQISGSFIWTVLLSNVNVEQKLMICLTQFYEHLDRFVSRWRSSYCFWWQFLSISAAILTDFIGKCGEFQFVADDANLRNIWPV